LYNRIDTSRKSTTPDERRKNADTVKGLIFPHLVPGSPRDYSANHSTTDIDVVIRRSEIELPHYELKQGLLELNHERRIDPNMFGKVIRTICAIANNGKGRSGTLIIGVTDKDSDAQRIKTLDGIEPYRVGRRFVVGVKREARMLDEKPEEYFARWKNAIRQSDLSRPLCDDVLSAMDYNDYYGLGLIIISIPQQKELSFVGDEVYFRQGDETIKAEGQRAATELSKRFS
jgi:predicted HTH transcriptional regulator